MSVSTYNKVNPLAEGVNDEEMDSFERELQRVDKDFSEQILDDDLTL